MLQLRQCKLAFPSVHLLVGCCSSELVREHKAQPVMHSEERYESLRHLKWVDEVVENAPWTVDKDFIDKWQIDYVAHDEEPYVSAGSEDVYAYAKSIGTGFLSLFDFAFSCPPPPARSKKLTINAARRSSRRVLADETNERGFDFRALAA